MYLLTYLFCVSILAMKGSLGLSLFCLLILFIKDPWFIYHKSSIVWSWLLLCSILQLQQFLLIGLAYFFVSGYTIYKQDFCRNCLQNLWNLHFTITFYGWTRVSKDPTWLHPLVAFFLAWRQTLHPQSTSRDVTWGGSGQMLP